MDVDVLYIAARYNGVVKRRSNFSYIIGIDEVGRGPLAGPITVGAVMLPASYDRALFRGIRDSKQLSPEAREEWYARASELARANTLAFTVSSVSAPLIDRRGIQWATRLALRRALMRLRSVPSRCLILLDGGLRAPEQFLHQETIIRGEEKEPIIALASIVAKVRRDRKMCRLSKKFSQYAFEQHKGYGTKEHYRKLERHGLCDLHRRSFVHI